MKEIKFKAWSKELNYLFDVQTINFSEKTVFELRTTLSDGYPIRRTHLFKYIELLQYTGLKDCNDGEIYEGDIISVHEDGENVFNHEVKYNNCGYWVDVNGVDFDYTSLTYATEQFCYEYEVIGNVHQNPELLE